MGTTRRTPKEQGAGTRRERWPEWIGYVAAGWSLVVGVLGATWALGGPGFPWGAALDTDPADDGGIFSSLRPGSTGLVLAIVGGIGVVLAVTLTRVPRPAESAGRLPIALRAVLTVPAILIALGALALVDERTLITLGYLVPVIVGAPFGWPPIEDPFGMLFPWPVVFQLICLVGVVCWLGTALSFARRARGACANCGRRGGEETGWTAPAAAARWGRIAAYVSMAFPVLYAAERYAWAFRIPLGFDEAGLDELHATGLWVAGVGLGTMALFGALMTLGLVRRWGEVFPRWLPLLGGRVVPVGFPVGCFVVVSTAVIALFPSLWSAGLGAGGLAEVTDANAALGLLTMLALPLWGIAMLVATAGYYFRRRGTCRHCPGQRTVRAGFEPDSSTR